MSGAQENSGGGEHLNNSNNPRIMGALEYPTDEERNITVQPNQPRQPHNLQDLLRFSVEAGQSVPGRRNVPFVPTPMDEGRKRFLEKTLKSMTVDVIAVMYKAIQTLKHAGDIDLEDDPSEYEAALEEIANYVDNMDTANDFFKIGGFTVFQACLSSPHSSLRWRAAEIIAELSQNNPYCQDRVVGIGLVPILMCLVDTDPVEQVRIKSLYALSCIIRGTDKALDQFHTYQGYSIMLRAMQAQIEKLQTKCAFLLTYICGHRPAIKDELYRMGFVEQLVGLISEGQPPALEHLMSALLSLVRDHPPSLEACRQPQLQLRRILRNSLKQSEGKAEREEEHEHTTNLLNLIFEGETEEER